ncbi:hemerythrin domain-containing protein [Nocardioides zhouii]|uniref:Hemerythrin domain-containing protein n=1 Tax=Nocardioides zhouii TaxID=1168729 RepID=A0A4Q2T6W5_9ACTN|nr:hemerythrin domain-containing protein [Nocardioides zhouii]RYC13873.1 hemerythrin domain-containing protein [Nocardioides zhouii]
MCEYCGCREVPAIAELMDEHTALADEGHYVRQALGAGDCRGAMHLLSGLVAHLDRHVRREEAGIFLAMRDEDEFIDEIEALEAEHRDLAAVVAALDVDATSFAADVSQLLDDLDTHVEREDLGIFPVSVVTLGATGWATVDKARRSSPSFLLDVPPQPTQGEPHAEGITDGSGPTPPGSRG